MSTLTHPPAVTPTRMLVQSLALLLAALVGVGIGFAIDDGAVSTVTVDEPAPAVGSFDQDRANEAYTKRLTSLYEMYRDREANPGTAPTSGVIP